MGLRVADLGSPAGASCRDRRPSAGHREYGRLPGCRAGPATPGCGHRSESLTSSRRCGLPSLGRSCIEKRSGQSVELDLARSSTPASPSSPSMPPRLITSSTAFSLPLQANFPVLRDALKPHRSTLTPKLWTVLESAKPGDASLLPAASALASYDPDNARWEAVGGKVAQALVSVNSVFLGPWLEALRPVRGKLTAPLATIFRDKSRPETEHALATNILTDYASDDPRPHRRPPDGRRPQGVCGVLPHRPAAGGEDLCLCSSRRSPRRRRYRRATRTQRWSRTDWRNVKLGRRSPWFAWGKPSEVWPLLRHSADPRLRSFIVNWLSPLGADPKILAAELDRIDPQRQAHARPGAAEDGRHPVPPRDLACGGR